MACRINAPCEGTSAYSTYFAWQVLFLDSFAFVSFHGAGKGSANASTPAVKLRESSSGQRQACELHVRRRSRQLVDVNVLLQITSKAKCNDMIVAVGQSGKPEAKHHPHVPAL